MADVTITANEHGPYKVTGGIQFLDANGRTVETAEDPVFLCRCGRSANKPFCDGTHKKIDHWDGTLAN